MNNLKQNANLLACYSKVSDKHVFIFSFLPSIFQSARVFFIRWRYVANFGILLAPESTFWKQTARSANFGRNALIIVSPNKTNPKKAMQFHRYGIFLIASICCRSSIWFHVLLFSLLDHWNRCQLTTYRCRVFVGQPPWVTTKPRHHPLPWRRRRFGNKNRAP